MAANYGVQKSTAAGVLSWYDNQDLTKWIIYRGRKENGDYFTEGYNGSDKEEGYSRLANFLNNTEPTDFNEYFLKLYPDNPKEKKTGPGITFQLFSMTAPGARYSDPDPGAMREILSELRAIREARMMEEEGEEAEEEETPQAPGSFLAGILENPQVQNVLTGVLLNIVSGFTKNPGPIKSVAGLIPDEIQDHVLVLMRKGVTAADFKILADMDPAKITMLLTMLRGQ